MSEGFGFEVCETRTMASEVAVNSLRMNIIPSFSSNLRERYHRRSGVHD